jgi:hypothetical protein
MSETKFHTHTDCLTKYHRMRLHPEPYIVKRIKLSESHSIRRQDDRRIRNYLKVGVLPNTHMHARTQNLPGGAEESNEILKIAGVPAEIWTYQLQNTSLQHYCYDDKLNNMSGIETVLIIWNKTSSHITGRYSQKTHSTLSTLTNEVRSDPSVWLSRTPHDLPQKMLTTYKMCSTFLRTLHWKYFLFR